MAFSDFLRHRCDIYHIQKTDESPGFGLPASPVFSYPDDPDNEGIPCYFPRGGSVTQSDPNAKYSVSVKLSLPIGTDVRVNDKIVDCGTGYEYIAEVPRKVKEHHMTVMIRRTPEQERL